MKGEQYINELKSRWQRDRAKARFAAQIGPDLNRQNTVEPVHSVYPASASGMNRSRAYEIPPETDNNLTRTVVPPDPKYPFQQTIVEATIYQHILLHLP